MKPKIILLEEGYRLEVGAAVSQDADYGEPIELEADGKAYIAFVDLDEDGAPITPLESSVYVGSAIECDTVDENEEDEEPAAAD